MDPHDVIENPEYLEKPNDNCNDNDNIEDFFDFAIHGDIGVDKP